MAGYDLMTAGRSPAEIRRLKARRKRMLAAADAREVDKPGTGKGNAKVKGRSPLVSSKTDQGRRDNERAQRLAKAKAKDKDKDKDAAAPRTSTITNPRGTMRGRKFFPAPDEKGTAPPVKTLKEYTAREAARRAAETARLNKEHNAKKARRGLQKFFPAPDEKGTAPPVKTLKEYTAREAAGRAAETARLNKEFSDKEAAEKGEKKPWWRFEKGGLVKKSAAKKTSSKKSIDGIARKGKTRAKHR
jgi:hypothetical protein